MNISKFAVAAALILSLIMRPEVGSLPEDIKHVEKGSQ